MTLSTIFSIFTLNKRNLIMMKNTMSKVIVTSLLSCIAFSLAHAADENISKADVKKQIQICAKKKQGEWVTYANKGVTFNGTCEPNENGKLQFSVPAPANGSPAVNTAPAEPIITTRPVQKLEPAATPEVAPNTINEAPQAIEQSHDQPAETPIQAQ